MLLAHPLQTITSLITSPSNRRQIPLWKKLPPELWLIIFEFVLGSSIVPLHQCNQITFPEILNQLRDPWMYTPPGLPALRKLRLVCRAFNSLLAYQTHHILGRAVNVIPSGAPVKPKCPCMGAKVSFQQLLADPAKSYRIVTLYLPGCVSYCSPVPAIFSLLCDNASSFPNVRSLTLGLYHHTTKCGEPPTLRFWGTLNDAFPDLVSLVLRGKFRFFSDLWERVVFRKLEVLDPDMVLVHSNVYFPVLRHAAFGIVSVHSVAQFKGWGLLESLLIRKHYAGAISWQLVPHLRLIAIPSNEVHGIFLQDHPLQHLYLFMVPIPKARYESSPYQKGADKAWTKRMVQYLSSLSRITLVYPPISNQSDFVWGDIDVEELVHSGFSRKRSSSGSRRGESRVVFSSEVEHDVEPPSEAQVEAPSQSNGFWAGWKRSFRFTSRMLPT